MTEVDGVVGILMRLKRIVWWLLLVLFIASGIWISFYLYSTYTTAQTMAEMSRAIAAARSVTPSTVSTGQVNTTTMPDAKETALPTASTQEMRDPLLAQYQTLAQKNADMIGWVSIQDTIVDYPVMYTPLQPQKYLHLDFEQRYSFSGLPFMDARCTPDNETQNKIIYAHNMRSGQMFAQLHQYLDDSYLAQHPTIHFDTLTQRVEYQVIAVLQVNLVAMTSPTMLCYSMFSTDTQQSIDELNAYLTKYATVRVSDALLGDSILTLSTCQHIGSIDRLVVVARSPKRL